VRRSREDSSGNLDAVSESEIDSEPRISAPPAPRRARQWSREYYDGRTSPGMLSMNRMILEVARTCAMAKKRWWRRASLVPRSHSTDLVYFLLPSYGTPVRCASSKP
jgi:hypothetical protein